jgi:hypothetical protein
MVPTETTEFLAGALNERALLLIVHIRPAVPETHTIVNDGTPTKRWVLFKVEVNALHQKDGKGTLIQFHVLVIGVVIHLRKNQGCTSNEGT